jgi:hypothetical protein
MDTPWGRADTTTIAPGIINCTTGSHGGFYVDERHFDAMPPQYQAIRWPTGRSRDNGAWFEEDSAWTGVVLTWPEAFLAYHRRELYSWQVLQPQKMHILEFSWNYYDRRGHTFYQDDYDWHVKFHKRQLQSLIRQAQHIYLTTYLNRQKEQS